MGEFILPTNIRQIGSISDGLRIYMEDYVFTYLHQFAEAGGYDERAAFLVGRQMVIDGQQVLFINGAIQGKEMEVRDGLMYFTEKSNAYADSVIKEYFTGMEIVGWMQSQPSYGVYLNQQYGVYHRHVFTHDFQVMFVMDPLEKTNCFYAFNAEHEAMQEVRGYFIYYDKNKNMHEYMLHDRATDKPAAPSAYVELYGGDESDGESYEDKPLTDTASRAEELIRKRAEDRTRRRSTVERKRSMNLMSGLSAVLFLVCFMMGAVLIQDRDKISEMQTQISQLNTAYRNLYVQMSSDGTSPVFAPQPEENPSGYALPEVTPDAQTLPIPTPEAGTATAEPSPSAPPVTQATDAPAAPVENLPAEVPVDEPVEPAKPEAYTIQPGDSLLNISLEFYGTVNMVDEILALNGIENADLIVSGKTIALP